MGTWASCTLGIGGRAESVELMTTATASAPLASDDWTAGKTCSPPPIIYECKYRHIGGIEGNVTFYYSLFPWLNCLKLEKCEPNTALCISRFYCDGTGTRWSGRGPPFFFRPSQMTPVTCQHILLALTTYALVQYCRSLCHPQTD